MTIWWTNSDTDDRSRIYPDGGKSIDVTFDHRPCRVTLRPRSFWGWKERRQLPAYPMVALSIGPIGLPIDVSQDIARRVRFILRRTWFDGYVIED